MNLVCLTTLLPRTCQVGLKCSRCNCQQGGPKWHTLEQPASIGASQVATHEAGRLHLRMSCQVARLAEAMFRPARSSLHLRSPCWGSSRA